MRNIQKLQTTQDLLLNRKFAQENERKDQTSSLILSSSQWTPAGLQVSSTEVRKANRSLHTARNHANNVTIKKRRSMSSQCRDKVILVSKRPALSDSSAPDMEMMKKSKTTNLHPNLPVPLNKAITANMVPRSLNRKRAPLLLTAHLLLTAPRSLNRTRAHLLLTAPRSLNRTRAHLLLTAPLSLNRTRAPLLLTAHLLLTAPLSLHQARALCKIGWKPWLQKRTSQSLDLTLLTDLRRLLAPTLPRRLRLLQAKSLLATVLPALVTLPPLLQADHPTTGLLLPVTDISQPPPLTLATERIGDGTLHPDRLSTSLLCHSFIHVH